MGGWPTNTKSPPKPQATLPQKVPDTGQPNMSRSERNNNDIITSTGPVETGAAASLSPLSKIWLLLTPKLLKVIIVVLASAVVAGTVVIVAIIVTHLAKTVGETPTTIPPPATSTVNLTSTTVSTSTSTSTLTTSTTTSPITPSTTTSTSTTSTAPMSSTSTTLSMTTSTTSISSTSTTTLTTTTTTAQECSPSEFPCASGECILWKHLCDGLPDCRDGSDEGINCVCGDDQWECTSGQCVSSKARCDQNYDCRDSSDEMECPDCSGFQCDSGLCLWDGNYRRCNGVFDCPDLSDEMGCSPQAGTLQCKNSVRVAQYLWCDGLDHCGDNSDEEDCTTLCRGMRIPCSDGQCIMRTWRCDGYPDCHNGTDEVGCGSCLPSEFMCDDYRCIDEAAVCDGSWDCRSGADELHCFSLQEETHGVLWARFQGADFPICSDEWTTDFAVQICSDISQLQLLEWEEVRPAPARTQFVAFNNNTLSAQTTNLAKRASCKTGRIISLSCHREECGERKVAFMQSFVAGGHIVSPGKWPWVVSLLHLGHFVCGGSLLHHQWVLTAAHCIFGAVRGDYNLTSTPYYFDVIVGSTHRLGMSHLGTPYRIRISEIHLHPHLKKLAFDAVDWDFALLKLSVPVDYTDYIQPVCLPHLGQSVSLTSLCYLAGWGLMNPQQVLSPEDLRDTRMQLWSDARCAVSPVPGETTLNTNATLCGGFPLGSPAACQGDSGGPLMCLSPSGRWMLTGVMSRGSTPCGGAQRRTRANHFARVPNAVDWIRQYLTES